MTSTVPEALNAVTAPVAPTGPATALGVVWPADQLTCETSSVGVVRPMGHSERNNAALGPATVTLSSTALGPVA